MRDLSRRITRFIASSRETERVAFLHADAYEYLDALMARASPDPSPSYEVELIATAWYDSQVLKQANILLQTNRSLVLSAWESKPRKIGTGSIQRIAIMEIGAREMLLLEKPTKPEESHWWELWKMPNITNPPTIVTLRKELFTEADKIRYRDIDSRFASVEEIRHYRELTVFALSGQPATFQL